MEKEFEAYYSKGSTWLFFAFVVVLLIIPLLFWPFWIPEFTLMFIITISIFCVIFLVVFNMLITAMKKDGLALSVENGALVLHKRKTVTIPLKDIVKITMSEAISFDISVKHANGRCSLHCFIKDQGTKKQEFVSLLEKKGIRVELVYIS